MNVKIKSAGVACLIGEDYDRVYATLKKNLVGSDEQLFTERTPGHEYLQWELPGEGWSALSDSDPLVANVVRQEWLRRQQMVYDRFGRNQDMAQRVLSVPDESYVYYKIDDTGNLQVRLTAWGYRYPERVQGGVIIGRPKPKEQKEHVAIQLLYDGKPIPDKTLRLNGLFQWKTDQNGMFEVGNLPLNYEFDVDVDEVHHRVKVMPGQGKIELDITIFTEVKVVATLDDLPYKGAAVSLTYGKRQMKLMTDEQGKVVVSLPLDLQNGLCTVTLDGEIQQMPLTEEGRIFTFRLKTPEKEILPEKDSERYGDVEVNATRNGQPYQFASVLLEYAGNRKKLTTDIAGKATTRLPLEGKGVECTVILGEEVQRKELSEGVTLFTFSVQESIKEKEDPEVPLPKASESVIVEVIALLDEQPYVGVPVEIKYGEHYWRFVTDNNGMVQTQIPFYAEEEWCTVALKGEKQQKKLLGEEKTSFLFQFKNSKVLPEQPEKQSWATVLLETAAGLFIAALLVATYLLGGEILFN